MDAVYKLFVSLECKYNVLQFGIRICSIEGSGAFSLLCLQQILQSSRSVSFLKSEGIKSDSRLA